MNYKALGRRIREERLKLNLTQEKLAENIELSTAYIGQIERGERSLTLETLTLLVSRLGITIDYLMSDSVFPSNEALANLWLQLMDGRTEAEQLLAINMVKLMFGYLDENRSVFERVQESFYILNTNVSNSTDDDADMLLNHKAAAYFAPAKFSIKRIRKGDRVFLYRSGVGIVAVGIGSGELKIKNYHNDPSQEDEEYYTPLNDFRKLNKPLSAKDIKAVASSNFSFIGTLSEINAQEGIRLWEHIHDKCV